MRIFFANNSEKKLKYFWKEKVQNQSISTTFINYRNRHKNLQVYYENNISYILLREYCINYSIFINQYDSLDYKWMNIFTYT